MRRSRLSSKPTDENPTGDTFEQNDENKVIENENENESEPLSTSPSPLSIHPNFRSAPPPPPLPPPYSTNPLRFIPFILLFFIIFISISLLSTGTVNYGLGPFLGQASLAKGVNNAKIFVQQLVGLRTPANRASQQTKTSSAKRVPSKKKKKQRTDAGEVGYGGITPSKTKQKQGSGPPSSIPIGSSHSSNGAPLLDIRPPVTRDPRAMYLTVDDLSHYKGEDGGPIFLSVYGRIFDVTSGREHYGPDGGYSALAGKDISRAFVNSCFNNPNLHDLRGLTPLQRKSIDSWYKFYADHPKYRPVGWLEYEPIPNDAPMPNDDC